MKKFIFAILLGVLLVAFTGVACASSQDSYPTFDDIRNGNVIGEFVNVRDKHCYILELTEKGETWVLNENFVFYIGVPIVGGRWHSYDGTVGFYLGTGHSVKILAQKIADVNARQGLVQDDRFKRVEDE